MIFPFVLKNHENWFDFVPEFLISLPYDSEFLNNRDFHRYIADKLVEYYPISPARFNSTIKLILNSATEAGKFLMIEVLLLSKSILRILSRDETFQPILTELALSPDKLYSKPAATLSSIIEDLSHDMDTSVGVPHPASTSTKSTIGTKEAMESAPSPPPPPIARPAPMRTQPRPEPSSKSMRLPDKHKKSKKMTTGDLSREVPISEKFEDLLDEVKVSEEESEESIVSTPPDHDTKKLQTHVHYFSRMNPRKTYPLTITLSSIEKKIRRSRIHILSGERESETRGEFDLTDITQELIVEPLISGCLVQPTFQFFNPEPTNLPKELTFFITPLVEAGLKSTPLDGTLYIKDDKGKILLDLKLPGIKVVSSSLSKIIATFGVIGGGALPFLDTFFFGGNLQGQVVSQLSYNARTYLPSLSDSVSSTDWWLILTTLQVLIFLLAIVGSVLLYWKKSRPKIAPSQKSSVQLQS